MKKNFKIILIFLAVILVCGLGLNILSKPAIVLNKGVKVPDSASDNFSGVMLSSYDDMRANYKSNYLTFDFDDVDVFNYDYIMLDFVDFEIYIEDSYVLEFGPDFSNEAVTSSLKNTVHGNLKDYEDGSGMDTWLYSEPIFNIADYDSFDYLHTFGSRDFTYLFDFREIKSGKITVNAYVDGVFSSSKSILLDSEELNLREFYFKYDDGGFEYLTDLSFGPIYLYGFEKGTECSISSYISNTDLKLTDCEDSLLYNAN